MTVGCQRVVYLLMLVITVFFLGACGKNASKSTSKVSTISFKNESGSELRGVRVSLDGRDVGFGFVGIQKTASMGPGFPAVGREVLIYYALCSEGQDLKEIEEHVLKYDPEILRPNLAEADEVKFVLRGEGDCLVQALKYGKEQGAMEVVFEELVKGKK